MGIILLCVYVQSMEIVVNLRILEIKTQLWGDKVSAIPYYFTLLLISVTSDDSLSSVPSVTSMQMSSSLYYPVCDCA